jgi:hypothetical protein
MEATSRNQHHDESQRDTVAETAALTAYQAQWNDDNVSRLAHEAQDAEEKMACRKQLLLFT